MLGVQKKQVSLTEVSILHSDSLRAGRSRKESRNVQDFPHPSRPALWSTQRPVQWLQCLFPAGKADGS